CIAYSHIPKDFRNKFDAKVEECVMMGYALTGYRLWNIQKRKIVNARDVEFNENRFWFKKGEVKINNDVGSELSDNETDKTGEILNENNDISNEVVCQVKGNSVNTRRNVKAPARFDVKAPARFDDFELYMAFDACGFVENVPICFEELENRPDKHNWLGAVDRELKAIESNDTWEKVQKPDNVNNILDTKWVFSYKTLEEKESDKFKAMLTIF
ncbi:hypothetical protein QE152_g41344, partial [Popillia japonica]